MPRQDSASHPSVRKMLIIRLTVDGAAQAIPGVLHEVSAERLAILAPCPVCRDVQAHARTIAGEALVHIAEVTALPDGTWLVGCTLLGLWRARRAGSACV